MNWPLDLDPTRDPERQRVWYDYRVELIRELTATISTAVRESGSELIVSASLKPEGALNADGVRLYGQSYEQLCPLLDFITPMAYHRLDAQPIAWVKAVAESGQWRAGSTPL